MILIRENQDNETSTVHTVTWSTTNPKCTGLEFILALCCEQPTQPSTIYKKNCIKLHRIKVQMNGMLSVSYLKGRCAQLLLLCLFYKNCCLYYAVRIVVGFSYVYNTIVSITCLCKNIFSILVYGVVVFTLQG